jgi:hypothetical protein
MLQLIVHIQRVFRNMNSSNVPRPRTDSEAELPDVFFSNQKSKFGQILEGHRLENVDIF